MEPKPIQLPPPSSEWGEPLAFGIALGNGKILAGNLVTGETVVAEGMHVHIGSDGSGELVITGVEDEQGDSGTTGAEASGGEAG